MSFRKFNPTLILFFAVTVIALLAPSQSGFAQDFASADVPESVAPPEHETRRFAGLLFLFGFLLWPFLFQAIKLAQLIALLVAASHFIRQIVLRRWAPVWWVLPVLFATLTRLPSFPHTSDLFGPLFWPAFVIGLLVWHGLERLMGRLGFATQGWLPVTSARRFAFVVLAGFIGWRAVAGAKAFLTVAAVWWVPPDPGNPPYQVQFAREWTLDTSVALARFPDAQSCLEVGAQADIRDDLLRMDWDLISTNQEAQVCLFRLLAALGDIEAFTAFAEAQGFTVNSPGFKPSAPSVERDGGLRVTAYWRIKEKGPRFPTTGLVRYLYAVPYLMSVNATWEKDRKTLRHVDISYSTL